MSILWEEQRSEDWVLEHSTIYFKKIRRIQPHGTEEVVSYLGEKEWEHEKSVETSLQRKDWSTVPDIAKRLR